MSLKVLHVIDSINAVQGGPSVSVPALAREQAKLGHQVTIVCRNYGYLGPIAQPEGLEIRSIPSSRWTKGQGGWGCAFRRLVEEEARKADVVHNHGLWLAANYYARRAANNAGKPLVISTRGMLEDWSLGRSKMRKRVAWMLFERENLRSAKLFHATSSSEAESISEALRRWKMVDGRWESPISDLRSPISPGPRIVVAPNGVDVPEKIPGKEVVEQKFPKLKGKEWVLFMSRIHPKKGIDVLLQAWKEQMTDRGQVKGGRREVVLVIAGADLIGYGAEVERMIREKGLGETVLMTGHVDGEVREALLGHSKFFVLPSHSENFGLVVAESLAAGRPVLTTTGTPWGASCSSIKMKMKIKEHDNEPSMNLEENGCGVICEVSGLNEALARMLRFLDEELDQMGAGGRKMVAERFSWKAAAEKVVDAYKLLIRNSDCGIRK